MSKGFQMAAVSDGGCDVSFVQIREACITAANWNSKSGWSSSTKDCDRIISEHFLRGLDYAVRDRCVFSGKFQMLFGFEDDELIAIDLKQGALVWSEKFGGTIDCWLDEGAGLIGVVREDNRRTTVYSIPNLEMVNEFEGFYWSNKSNGITLRSFKWGRFEADFRGKSFGFECNGIGDFPFCVGKDVFFKCYGYNGGGNQWLWLCSEGSRVEIPEFSWQKGDIKGLIEPFCAWSSFEDDSLDNGAAVYCLQRVFPPSFKVMEK